MIHVIWVVPEKIHTHRTPWKVIRNPSWRGSQQPKFVRRYWEFQGGGRIQIKKIFHNRGRYGYFLEPRTTFAFMFDLCTAKPLVRKVHLLFWISASVIFSSFVHICAIPVNEYSWISAPFWFSPTLSYHVIFLWDFIGCCVIDLDWPTSLVPACNLNFRKILYLPLISRHIISEYLLAFQMTFSLMLNMLMREKVPFSVWGSL